MEAYPKDFRFSSKGVCNSREEKSDELKVVSCHDGGQGPALREITALYQNGPIL